MRIALLLLACLGLTACERPVVSRKPLFPQGQAGPVLRPGVWLYEPASDCKIDANQPTARWPDCAEWTLIAQGRIVGLDWRRSKARDAVSMISRPFDLEAGDPIILQTPSDQHAGRTAYKALKSLRVDAQGRIVEATIADLACAPPPRPGVAAALPPGLTGTHELCYAKDAETVRRVAVASLAEGGGRDLHWVRDGDR